MANNGSSMVEMERDWSSGTRIGKTREDDDPSNTGRSTLHRDSRLVLHFEIQKDEFGRNAEPKVCVQTLSGFFLLLPSVSRMTLAMESAVDPA